jgi:hypothetical protein
MSLQQHSLNATLDSGRAASHLETDWTHALHLTNSLIFYANTERPLWGGLLRGWLGIDRDTHRLRVTALNIVGVDRCHYVEVRLTTRNAIVRIAGSRIRLGIKL